MEHSGIYSAEGRFRIADDVLPASRCAEIVESLDESDDWSIAQVTDNGDAYMIMPTIRRQKIIEREDAEGPTLQLLREVEQLALTLAVQDGLDPNETDVHVSQLIRSDIADFFIWHADTKPGLPRQRSYYFVFNDDYIGGDIEFWNGEGAEPVIKHLKSGQCLSYESLVHSRHHKILRGSCFAALVIVGRNEEAQRRYEEENPAEDSSSQ